MKTLLLGGLILVGVAVASTALILYGFSLNPLTGWLLLGMVLSWLFMLRSFLWDVIIWMMTHERHEV